MILVAVLLGVMVFNGGISTGALGQEGALRSSMKMHMGWRNKTLHETKRFFCFQGRTKAVYEKGRTRDRTKHAAWILEKMKRVKCSF
jgi:hypothetical protein